LINNKNQPIELKISPVSRSNHEKNNDSHKNLHQTPSWTSPPFWKHSRNINRKTTFQRLPFREICCIGIDGFVKIDFFTKNRFIQFAPPSWILNLPAQLSLKQTLEH
jgi:hypothetical protein